MTFGVIQIIEVKALELVLKASISLIDFKAIIRAERLKQDKQAAKYNSMLNGLLAEQ